MSNSKKPIIIAGNGPSLAQIDYSLLPKDFDVFRCNQFYFEDRYFLGKKIKGVFYSFPVLREQFFTLHYLRQKGEYHIDDVYCRLEEAMVVHKHYGIAEFKNYFPTILDTQHYISSISAFNELDNFYKFYYCKEPTSAIYMLITAIAQGYKEIYLTGIDFYRGGGTDYAFEVKNKRIGEMIPAFNQEKSQVHFLHSKEVDLAFLQLALQMEGIKIYCISPQSPLAEIIPLSMLGNTNPIIPLPKPKDYICDFMELPSFVLENKIIESSKFSLKNQAQDVLIENNSQDLKSNIFFILAKDAYVLMKFIFKLVKNAFTHRR